MPHMGKNNEKYIFTYLSISNNLFITACEPCHASCRTCYNSSQTCASCFPPAIIIKSTGQCDCPPYYKKWYDPRNPPGTQMLFCDRCYHMCPSCKENSQELEEKCYRCVEPLLFKPDSKKCEAPPGKNFILPKKKKKLI